MSSSDDGVASVVDGHSLWITRPGPHDVLCGRGGGTNHHSGNIKFRRLIQEHKQRYLSASKVEKPHIAREVVQLWRALDPPGRFLAQPTTPQNPGRRRRSGSLKAIGNTWYDVGNDKAREKVSQCLRERFHERRQSRPNNNNNNNENKKKSVPALQPTVNA